MAARAATHPTFSLAALAAELHASRGRLDAFATGDEYRKWLEAADTQHRELMTKGALLAK